MPIIYSKNTKAHTGTYMCTSTHIFILIYCGKNNFLFHCLVIICSFLPLKFIVPNNNLRNFLMQFPDQHGK